MDTTRRGFLTTAVGAAAGAATGQAQAAEAGHDHQDAPSDMTLRVKSLESLLVEKGLVDPAALDALVDTFEHKVGPRNGARVVAKAWTDPAYKRRLLADADSAIAELGYTGQQGEHMVVLENTPPSIIWSSARYAPVIRGRLSVCRPSGTNRRPTGRAR